MNTTNNANKKLALQTKFVTFIRKHFTNTMWRIIYAWKRDICISFLSLSLSPSPSLQTAEK
jgi:hypothetical protein